MNSNQIISQNNDYINKVYFKFITLKFFKIGIKSISNSTWYLSIGNEELI